MTPSFATLVALVFLTDYPVELCVRQVAPAKQEAAVLERSPERPRAVVLIQGLQPHFFSERNAGRAQWQSWQLPGSRLVGALGETADVFAVAYSQNVPIERLADTFAFRSVMERIRQLGYREIVLVGHSAGGLVARQFVEDHPKAGVTKVIQVCSPNTGSTFASADWSVRQPQEIFLDSLRKKHRQACFAKRPERKVPPGVEFVCLAGVFHLDVEGDFAVRLGNDTVQLRASLDKRGDGLVSAESQWPADLQAQGVPVAIEARDHFRMVRGRQGTETIVRLVSEPQPRWNQEQVAEARRAIWGKP